MTWLVVPLAVATAFGWWRFWRWLWVEGAADGMDSGKSYYSGGTGR